MYHVRRLRARFRRPTKEGTPCRPSPKLRKPRIQHRVRRNRISLFLSRTDRSYRAGRGRWSIFRDPPAIRTECHSLFPPPPISWISLHCRPMTSVPSLPLCFLYRHARGREAAKANARDSSYCTGVGFFDQSVAVQLHSSFLISNKNKTGKSGLVLVGDLTFTCSRTTSSDTVIGTVLGAQIHHLPPFV